MADGPYGGLPLLADSSAWTAVHRATLLGNAPTEWRDALSAGLILTSPVVRLEMLHSARNSAEFERIEELHASLRRDVPLTNSACLRAVGALRELAAKSNGYHRVGLGDALIAASAEDADGVAGVLHYNPGDFDRLAEVLSFESVEVAPAGTFEKT